MDVSCTETFKDKSPEQLRSMHIAMGGLPNRMMIGQCYVRRVRGKDYENDHDGSEN